MHSHSISPEVQPTITADLAFQNAANHTAAYYAAQPAFVQYDVHTDVIVRGIKRSRHFDKSILLRTADDATVQHDVPQDAGTLEPHPYPCTPLLDPISSFRIAYGMTMGGAVRFNLTEIEPLHFSAPPNTGADVVVSGSRAYHVSYAADSSAAPDGATHLLFHPYQHFLANLPHDDFYFHDAIIDNTTGLPREFSFIGTNDLLLSFTYGMHGGHWVLDRGHFEQSMIGPFHIGRVHFISDVAFANYQFPTSVAAGVFGGSGAPAIEAAGPAASVNAIATPFQNPLDPTHQK